MFITFAAERHIGWQLPNMNLTLYCWEKKILPIVPFFYQEHQIYLSFLQTCMDFFCQSIIAGIPLRGCVSSGFALMDSNKSGAVVVVSSVIFSLLINSPFHAIRFRYPLLTISFAAALVALAVVEQADNLILRPYRRLIHCSHSLSLYIQKGKAPQPPEPSP